VSRSERSRLEEWESMTHCTQQAFIDAPLPIVWELLSDIDHHQEWWPQIVEVECDGLEPGCTYRQVIKNPLGLKQEDEVHVEALEDAERLAIRCHPTGTFIRFTLAEAQGGTFVDGEAGMDPERLPHRVFDAVAGKRFYRNWLAQMLELLDQAARRQSRAAG